MHPYRRLPKMGTPTRHVYQAIWISSRVISPTRQGLCSHITLSPQWECEKIWVMSPYCFCLIYYRRGARTYVATLTPPHDGDPEKVVGM